MTTLRELAQQLTAKAVEAAVTDAKANSLGEREQAIQATGETKAYMTAAIMTGETTEGEVFARVEAALYD